MRTEEQMFELILGFAQRDDRVRAVYLNGSRANGNVPKDVFQDYDIVYVVEETSSFIEDRTWMKTFGDLLMLQEPDRLDKELGHDVVWAYAYAFLMLFDDGNRIDLRLLSLEAAAVEYGKDSLTVPLLDKDGILPTIPESSDCDYHVKPPMKAQFDSCTNDFWWCLQNVAKGIWRDELPYAMQMFESVIRVRLDEMVDWWLGMQHGYQLSPGKMGKFYKRYLPEQYWKMYKATYSDANYRNIWDAVFTSCELFRTLAKDVALHNGFLYPEADDDRMTVYLRHIRQLPLDADAIYE